MSRIYLFDWGDTLMIDNPSLPGKMCDWPQVEATPHALETLRRLSRRAEIYIATNAENSVEADVRHAFLRVGLDDYIQGYFCKQTLGVSKGTPLFYHMIIERLNAVPAAVTMVGDTLENDILPAAEAGLQTIWYNPGHQPFTSTYAGPVVHCLTDILDL